MYAVVGGFVVDVVVVCAVADDVYVFVYQLLTLSLGLVLHTPPLSPLYSMLAPIQAS